jgi:hypothetical protein
MQYLDKIHEVFEKANKTDTERWFSSLVTAAQVGEFGCKTVFIECRDAKQIERVKNLLLAVLQELEFENIKLLTFDLRTQTTVFRFMTPADALAKMGYAGLSGFMVISNGNILEEDQIKLRWLSAIAWDMARK